MYQSAEVESGWIGPEATFTAGAGTDRRPSLVKWRPAGWDQIVNRQGTNSVVHIVLQERHASAPHGILPAISSENLLRPLRLLGLRITCYRVVKSDLFPGLKTE